MRVMRVMRGQFPTLRASESGKSNLYSAESDPANPSYPARSLLRTAELRGTSGDLKSTRVWFVPQAGLVSAAKLPAISQPGKRGRGPGRPFVKGQPSANPHGRPRSPNSLAELGRETVEPSELIDRVLKVVRGDDDARALSAVAWLASACWAKPPTDQNLHLSQANASDDFDYSKLSIEELRQLTELNERAQIGSSSDPQPTEPRGSDDDDSLVTNPVTEEPPADA